MTALLEIDFPFLMTKKLVKSYKDQMFGKINLQINNIHQYYLVIKITYLQFIYLLYSVSLFCNCNYHYSILDSERKVQESCTAYLLIVQPYL